MRVERHAVTCLFLVRTFLSESERALLQKIAGGRPIKSIKGKTS
jgi:hypothetical protein